MRFPIIILVLLIITLLPLSIFAKNTIQETTSKFSAKVLSNEIITLDSSTEVSGNTAEEASSDNSNSIEISVIDSGSDSNDDNNEENTQEQDDEGDSNEEPSNNNGGDTDKGKGNDPDFCDADNPNSNCGDESNEEDTDKGHGNNPDHCDPDNPGKAPFCDNNNEEIEDSNEDEEEIGDEENPEEDENKGHGNNEGCDPDNPGKAPFCDNDEPEDEENPEEDFKPSDNEENEDEDDQGEDEDNSDDHGDEEQPEGPNENIPPVAEAGYDNMVSNREDDFITLDGSRSYDPDGEIVMYEWDFGDGTVVSGPDLTNPTHHYVLGGDFFVTLTVTDNGGLTSSDTTCIGVIDYS